MPMKDAVEQVLRAESDGKKGLAQARLKSEAMLADAETRARGIAERSAREAQEKAKSLRAAARAKSEAERDRVLKETEERVRREAIEKAPVLDKAAGKVMEFLLG
jgi:vacuolar-type H+-ATPase subunit H